MTKSLRQLAARHLLWLAERHLRECENAFTQHLADDALPYVAEISKAERLVAEAVDRVIAADALQRSLAMRAADSSDRLDEAAERPVGETHGERDTLIASSA